MTQVDQKSATGLASDSLLLESDMQPLGPILPPAMTMDLEVLAVAGDASIHDVGTTHAKVTDRVVDGTSALGLGVFIERGAGFVANILAARFGGTSTFGAYSLAISTANQISTYAAGGIGATSARFSGKYSYESSSYSNLARALAIVSLASAVFAATALWFGSGPIAHLLGRQQLTSLLRWAALSAAGMILLECARGFFVGQRRLTALVVLSLLVGGGMIVLLPLAAMQHDPIRMVIVQGCIITSAVLICVVFNKRLGVCASGRTHVAPSVSLATMLREVWTFGLVQLVGLVGANLAGWWLMTLVARSDTSLVQMSFFAIASQLRNLVGIAPGLLTEGSYAVMADPSLGGPAEDSTAQYGPSAARNPAQVAHRVMALCSFASLAVALLLASFGMVFVPWLLTLLYGRSYAPAGLTVVLGLAVSVVHMGNAPAAARLTIVSIRSTGVINTIWAVFVACAASAFLFIHGSAWQAMLIYFVAHLLSSGLVLATLNRKDHLPRGMALLFWVGSAAVAIMALLAYLRYAYPNEQALLTVVMFLLFVLSLVALILLGYRYQWLPSASLVSRILSRVPLPFKVTKHV